MDVPVRGPLPIVPITALMGLAAEEDETETPAAADAPPDTECDNTPAPLNPEEALARFEKVVQRKS